MLIDSLDLKHSGSCGKKVCVGPSQERFIVDWANHLQSVGWSTEETLHAIASVTFPLGAPVTAGITVLPKTVVGCNAPPGFITIGAQEFSLYDSFTQVPGSTTSCIFFPMGTTAADTLANLVIAINGAGVWFAVLTFNGGVNYTLDLTATTGGPLFNDLTVNSSGFLSGGVTTYGGGYRMRSSASSNCAQYDCTLTCANRGGAGPFYLSGILKFDFTINGGHHSYQLLDDVQGTLGFMGALGVGAVPQYTILANPFGFGVFDFPHDVTTHQFRTVSLFCAAPYFPTSAEVPTPMVPAYAVFVIGPNQIGGSPAWMTRFMDVSTMSLDGAPFVTNGFNPTARALALRSPIHPLLTVYGVPLFVCPYVQFGSNDQNTDPAWIVGKLFDCALVTDYVAVGANLDGHDFGAMGNSGGLDNNTYLTFLMDEGTTNVYSPLGQSARCASATGNAGSTAVENTGH